MSKELLRLRKRFFDDLNFYAARALSIRTKQGTIASLSLNSVQQRFHAEVEDQRQRTGRVRKIILKGRQQGLSTYVGGRMYWRLSQRKARKGLVVAHKADSTRALFDMYTRYHVQCPELLKPSTKYSSRKELSFDVLDTSLMVATAGGDGIARGETITDAHLSELAFWPKATAAENLNGLLQAIPNADDTEIFIESTANGYNEFYDLWTGAVAGTNGFEPFFAAWYESPEYRDDVPADFERTFEEQDLVEKHGLDDAQLVWRRRKIGENGRELFSQEYPSTPDEAFIASGRPVFDPAVIMPLIERAPAPLRRMAVEQKWDEKTAQLIDHVVEHTVGELYVYKERDDTQTYTIGCDVAMGVRGGDYSVAQILDGTKEQVAVWRGHCHPDAFARILSALGHYYNVALIAPERNSHGLLTCVRLWKDLAYPRVFLDVTEGQIADRDSLNVGFLTTVRTKPLIIDRLRAAVRDGEIKINDEQTLREMSTFIVTESGALEAEEGKFDDRVLALAIANHCHVRHWTPIVVSDEFYVRVV